MLGGRYAEDPVEFEEIGSYIAGLYDRQGELTKQRYADDTELKEFTPTVDDDVARLLQILLAVKDARRVLEVGTSIGYSTVAMAKTVRERGGRVVTVECDERVARQAQANFERLGVADCVDLRIGDARHVVPSLSGGFDLVFMDVDKRLYAPLLKDCVRLLRPGGLFVAEDTLFPVLDLDPKWRYLVEPIRSFNELLAAEPELQSTIVPVGDGVTIAAKRRPARTGGTEPDGEGV